MITCRELQPVELVLAPQKFTLGELGRDTGNQDRKEKGTKEERSEGISRISRLAIEIYHRRNFNDIETRRTARHHTRHFCENRNKSNRSTVQV